MYIPLLFAHQMHNSLTRIPEKDTQKYCDEFEKADLWDSVRRYCQDISFLMLYLKFTVESSEISPTSFPSPNIQSNFRPIQHWRPSMQCIHIHIPTGMNVIPKQRSPNFRFNFQPRNFKAHFIQTI